MGSNEYYELRAIEEIHAARSYRQSIAKDQPGTYGGHITKAIQLLVLAELNHGSNQDD